MNEQLVPEMSQIQRQVLKRAMLMLEGLRCPYAIIDPLGQKHGVLEVNVPNIRSHVRKYPHGERSKYVGGFIKPMGVGEVVVVPYGKYEPDEVQRSAHSFANKLWSAGCLNTTMNHEKQHLEILRIT
jgi:hypothetical protein